ADREQQRIARQERGDHQAGFAEDDQEQQHVEPAAHRSGEIVQMRVEMKEDINCLLDELHQSCSPDVRPPHDPSAAHRESSFLAGVAVSGNRRPWWFPEDSLSLCRRRDRVDGRMPDPQRPAADSARQTAALFAVAVAVLTWGCSNVVIKAIPTGGIVASFYRLWFSVPLLWLLPLLRWPLRERLTRDWLYASLVGGGLFALHQVTYFTSLKLTTVADVTLIGAPQPPLGLAGARRMF